jgi:hypothetical protein
MEFGRKGLWTADQNIDTEYTQAAVRFYREERATSSHSVLANWTLALDCARYVV